MGRKEFNKILRRYSEGKCTPEEKALVQKWYDAIGRDIQFSLNEERSEKLERELWNKLSFRIHNDDSVEQRTASTVWNWKTARIAASVLLLVGILSYVALGTFNSKTPSVAINASETVITNHDVFDKLVQLEDGSQITLKPKSEVSFARHFLKEKREIKLTGEAFFEVAHDEQRPFIVYTRNVITRVLGTSFLVQAAESNPAVVVSVKTGRVSVSREAKEFFGMRKTIREEAILTAKERNQHILAALKKHKAAAGLFVVGKYIQNDQDRALAEIDVEHLGYVAFDDLVITQ